MRIQAIVSLLMIVMLTSVARAEDENEKVVKMSDCPKAVQKTLKRESRDGKIVEVEKGKVDGKVIFEAEVWFGKKEYEVQVRADGMLVAKILEGQKDDEENGDEDDEEEKEESVSKADLPKPVKKTLAKESRGGKVEEIERVKEGGKTVYEAEVEINGKDYEVEIASDGTLLSKELDNDDGGDDDEDHADKDDDDDEHEDDD